MHRNRTFCVIVIFLLSAMAWMMVVSVRDESQTWDEAMHLSAGYSYWKTGDYGLNREHPPLGKLIASLPLLWMDLHLPIEHSSWQTKDEMEFGRQFLYRNNVPADTILFRARLMMIGLTLLFGARLAFWTRAVFGVPVAIVTLTLFCFEPTIIAHGRYVTTDLIIAFTSFLAITSWLSWLQRGGLLRLLWTGIALGLAMVSKFSWPFLLPIFLIAVLLTRTSFLRAVGGFCTAVLIGAVVIGVTYAPVASQLIPATRSYRKAHPQTIRLWDGLREREEEQSFIGKAAVFLSNRIGIQPHPYLVGLYMQASHNNGGHPSYLLGKVSKYGWWYYFPVAFAVKEPTGLLFGLAASLFVWLIILRKGGAERTAQWLALAVVSIYFAIVMKANLNIGIRHLMPVLPFIHILVASILWTRWRHVLLICTLLVIAETSWRHPYYLPFFNVLAGGPLNGSKYLVDSNLDWGQDYKRLKAWAIVHEGEGDLCTLLFNSAPLDYYNISDTQVGRTDDTKFREAMDCYAAVSVTPLRGVYVPKEELSWLREKKPITTIGYSINIYDLRKSRK